MDFTKKNLFVLPELYYIAEKLVSYSSALRVQCTLDLVTLLVSTKTVTKPDNVTKYIIFM